MKKHILLSLLFIISTNLALGQRGEDEISGNEKVEITYNSRTGEVSNYPPYEVSQNGYIIFEIEDINLFRYTITLTELQNNVINSTRLSEGNTQVSIDPNLFNLTDLNLNIQVIPVAPNDKTEELADLEKEIAELEKKIDRKISEIEEAESDYIDARWRVEEVDELERELNQINSDLGHLNAIEAADRTKVQKDNISYLNKNKRQVETEKQTLSTIYKIDEDKSLISDYQSTQKDNLYLELNTFKDELDDVNHQYIEKVVDDISFNTRLQNFNTALEAYIISLRKLNEITDCYQRLVSLLYSDQPFHEIKLQKTKIAFDVIKIENATKDDILKYCYYSLRGIDKKYLKLSQAFSLISTLPIPEADKAKEIIDKISAFNEQIKTNSYHAFFMQLAKVYDAINQSNFTLRYQTLIMSDNADQISFNLNAQPHTNLPGSVGTKPINFKYDVKINGGVKIDISTGIFWNIGLNDKSYRYESLSDSSTQVIEEENENHFIPSFGLLFNIYKRSSKDIKFGGNFGFSTNTDRLNYYLGASLLIGKSERVNLNFGLAGTQVNRVSDLYDTDQPFKIPISDLPNEVPLRNPNPFKIGAYFGISFNLLGRKNNETLSQISTL